MTAHSSVLAWGILRTEEPGGLQSMGSQRVGQDWSILACVCTHTDTQHACTHACTVLLMYFVVRMVPALTAGGSCTWLLCQRGFFCFSSCLLPPTPSSSFFVLVSHRLLASGHQEAFQTLSVPCPSHRLLRPSSSPGGGGLRDRGLDAEGAHRPGEPFLVPCLRGGSTETRVCTSS